MYKLGDKVKINAPELPGIHREEGVVQVLVGEGRHYINIPSKGTYLLREYQLLAVGNPNIKYYVLGEFHSFEEGEDDQFFGSYDNEDEALLVARRAAGSFAVKSVQVVRGEVVA